MTSFLSIAAVALATANVVAAEDAQNKSSFYLKQQSAGKEVRRVRKGTSGSSTLARKKLRFLQKKANAEAPYNGAPLLEEQSLPAPPPVQRDEEDGSISVNRLLPNSVKHTGCEMGDQADKTGCLNKADGAECMWARIESRNPLLPIQEANSYCMPCLIDGEEIPCWNLGGWVDGKQVTDCEMRCAHQKKIRQPEYTCSDESGFITQGQCFDRGARSGSKCMHLMYETESGEQKSSCAPCFVTGTGGWGCPAGGSAGPEGGSKVTGCLSQCDVICMGPPDCAPTAAPPPLPPPPSAGVPQTTSGSHDMLKAPFPVPLPTVNPYAAAMAAAKAAEAAGWTIGTPAPPTSYYPVIIYRKPTDYIGTPGPPPSSLGYPATPR